MTATSPPPLPHGLQLSPISSPLRPRTSPSTILDPEASATFFPERTYHLAILEEMFFKARRMYEEHQLAPPIQLLTRTSSDKAARVYYAMYTLLQASISASQADKLEHYIRTKAPQLSPLLFNLKEWESSLSIARLVRTHELKDARMQLMGQRQQLAAQLLDASATLRAMGKDVTNLKATALRDAAELWQLMKNTQEAVMGAVGAFVARQDEALRAKDAAARQAADNLADEQQRGAQVDAARAALAVELAAAKEAVTVLRKRVKALEVREKELLRRTEAAEDAAQAAMKKSNKAVREAAADLAEAEEKLAAAAAETDALREEVRKAGDTSARLAVSQSTVRELETTVAALRDAAQEQTAEVGNLRKSVDLTQRAFQEEAARAADAAEARERALAEEIEAGLGRRLADAQAAWAASQQPALDALEKESADQRARGALLEAQVADERTRAVGLEAAAHGCAALKAELDEWKARAAAVDGAVQPAAAAPDAPDARVEGLEAAMRRQATDHAAAMAERGGEVAALKAELEEWKARAAAAAATVAAPEAAPAPQPATAAPAEQPVEPSPQPAAALALTEAAASGPVFAEPVVSAAEAHVAPPVEPLAEVDTPVDAPAEIDAEVDPAPLAPADAADNGHDEMSLSDCSEAALSEREVLDRDSAVVATGSAVDPAEGPAVDADAEADVGANAPDAVEEGVEADTQPAAVSVLAAAKAAAEAVAVGEEQAAAPAETPGKASKDKPKLRRRDSMMAMQGDEGGEGGDEDDEDAPVLTDLEDRFLTAVAYNKVRARPPGSAIVLSHPGAPMFRSPNAPGARWPAWKATCTPLSRSAYMNLSPSPHRVPARTPTSRTA